MPPFFRRYRHKGFCLAPGSVGEKYTGFNAVLRSGSQSRWSQNYLGPEPELCSFNPNKRGMPAAIK